MKYILVFIAIILYFYRILYKYVVITVCVANYPFFVVVHSYCWPNPLKLNEKNASEFVFFHSHKHLLS